MSTRPMTQEELDTIQERVDDMWETDANFVAAYAREDVPALLAEVERLRARLTVDDAMVERAARAFYEDPTPGVDVSLCTDWDRLIKASPDVADKYRAAVRAALDAALDAANNYRQEGA